MNGSGECGGARSVEARLPRDERGGGVGADAVAGWHTGVAVEAGGEVDRENADRLHAAGRRGKGANRLRRAS